MSKTTLVAALIFIVLGFSIYMKESEKDLSYVPLKHDAVVLAFGDSITYGFGAPLGHSYPAVFESETGYHVINAGVSGEESAQGLKRLPTLLRKRPKLVILCHGGNDILRKHSREELKNNLLKMVKLIKKSGAIVMIVGVPDFHLLGFKPLPLYKEVAKETGAIYEGKVLSYIEQHRELKSDYVHPNEKGYKMMADAFAQLLRKNNLIE